LAAAASLPAYTHHSRLVRLPVPDRDAQVRCGDDNVPTGQVDLYQWHSQQTQCSGCNVRSPQQPADHPTTPHTAPHVNLQALAWTVMRRFSSTFWMLSKRLPFATAAGQQAYTLDSIGERLDPRSSHHSSVHFSRFCRALTREHPAPAWGLRHRHLHTRAAPRELHTADVRLAWLGTAGPKHS
jgi:hypothetical protein